MSILPKNSKELVGDLAALAIGRGMGLGKRLISRSEENKEEAYAKKLAESEREEESRLKRERKRDMLAQRIGSSIPTFPSEQTRTPRAPNLQTEQLLAGITDLIAQGGGAIAGMFLGGPAGAAAGSQMGKATTDIGMG